MAFPRKVVFVGGAPRSGTTITHALLCTAPKVNRFHPEISFFRWMPMCYRKGMESWGVHTSAFFPDENTFRRLMRETAMVWLRQVWTAVAEPEILCVKDPLLTILFPELHALLPDSAWFVTVCRHPFDVVRSRQEVNEKSGVPFGPADVEAVAREYMACYGTVLSTSFGGRHLIFRYEDLNTDRVQNALRQIVEAEAFNLGLLWQSADSVDAQAAWPENNPWETPKYRRELDLEPRLSPLLPEWQDRVRSICEPVMQKMGYS